MKRLLREFAAGMIGLLLVCTHASAQLSTAQLSGRVTDESGAVLPGVTVTVTQTATGFTRSDVTNANGAYVMSNLPLGPYRLEAALAGFRTYVRTGIILQVAASPVINAVLAVGGLEESVTVEAAAPIVDVQRAGISDVVQSEKIVELPLNGRNPVDLVMIAGAAVPTTQAESRSFAGGIGISVAGGQSYGVAYLLDGAMHNNPQDNLNLPFPFPDALQEFSVATSGLAAQNGMHSGASVNAVTKSGTNRFSGNMFEFLRDRRFNSIDPFSPVGPGGKQKDDGLNRNQYGGTFGGPIVQNKLFFFGAYQGTRVKQQPASITAWVPTAAMLNGDFTTFASAQCNSGGAVTLTGGFVNNRIDPALLSPAAVKMTRKYLPITTDPCGEVQYAMQLDSNERQYVGKVDFQRTADDTIFGRYMATSYTKVSPIGEGATVLNLYDFSAKRGETALDNLAHSLVVGDTRVFGSNTVNSIRGTFNRVGVNRIAPEIFEPADLGIKAYSYAPHVMVVDVRGNAFQANNPGMSRFTVNASQASDDLTVVRGSHQLAFGGSVAYWRYHFASEARSGGNWRFTGQYTGLGLSDFLMGRVAVLEQGGPARLPMSQLYAGLYTQDTWRANSRVTINAGVRWEPYFGQTVLSGAVYNFSMENFLSNTRSTVYHNAPAGLVYPGDPGFPSGKRGLNTQWWNLSPRAGLGWDLSGDGRTALRTSYGLSYDFPNAEYNLINANSPPFGNRTQILDPPGRFDDPYGHFVGGNPHPIATNADTEFLSFGAYGAIDPENNSPRVQQWNMTIEKQLGSDWGVAASYLGSHTDRLWNQFAINPGVFLTPAEARAAGVGTSSTTANTNQRRVLSLSGKNPAAAALIGNLDIHRSIGTQDYKGLKMSFQRRAANGVSLSGNYTVGRCFGDPSGLQTGGFAQIANGYLDPQNPAFDRGPCDQDRTHLGTLIAGVLTPRFAGRALRVVASDWRVSGIFSARSGAPINVISGQDRALTGINNQRVDVVPGVAPYGDKTLNHWLNPAAFAQPALGTIGDFKRNSLRGPGFRTLDVALSRLVRFGGIRTIEFRVETFNLLNTFNWHAPWETATATHVNFNSGSFGRITSMEGAPRIMQFGIKYGF
jgi:hypothetical protein